MPARLDDIETLAHRVRRLRLGSGLTQGQLAARMRVSQVRISQIEAGADARPLPLRTLCDLADGLGVDFAELVAGDPRYEHVEFDDPSDLAPTMTTLHAVEPLFDRSLDLAAVVALLRDEATRLVTIIGPAGVGKTQLALHVADALRDDFPEQRVISLAACRDLASVLSTIARAVGVRERDARPLRQRLVTALRDHRMLLLLDNVEQALSAAATLVTELVAACPQLTLLVTSRAPLCLGTERTHTVQPLRLPDPGHPDPVAAAMSAPAVQMFAHRARSAVPGFSITETNVTQVTAICRRLDGLPLAIELAAPRTRVMTLEQLLRQLDRRLPLLTSGARDLPPRQQSLRANIAWSVELLTSDQQALFRRLAVFVDGFTLEDAMTVFCGAWGESAPLQPASTWSPTELAVGVSSLLEQNLLTRSAPPEGVPRFGMLETIHEYANEQLEYAGELAEFRHRHLICFARLAEGAVPKLFTADDTTWLSRLQQEDANLQVALGWAFSPSSSQTDFELGLCLAGSLSDYWFLTGQLSKGRDWLTQAATLSAGQAPSHGQACSLAGACLVEQTRAAIEPALRFGEQGLEVAEALGDQRTIGRTLLCLGNLAIMEQRFPEAQAWHERALICFQNANDHAWAALTNLNLGLVDFYVGRFDLAELRAAEGLTLAREIGDRWDTLNGLHVLGLVARARGHLSEAYALYGERISLSWEFGSQRDLADSLSGIGAIAVAEGDLERAARFFGVAEGLYRRLAIGTPPPLWPDWAALTEEVQHGVAASHLEHLWTSTTIEEAIREAMNLMPTPTT